MAPPLSDCPVENHDAHDLPRLYVTREPGRLWPFDLCNPHVWPGSHWGIPDEVRRLENGSIISQGLTGDERCVAATGKTMYELRSALVAHLAATLCGGDTLAHVSVEMQLPQHREGEITLDWEPSLPSGYVLPDTGTEIQLQPESGDALEQMLSDWLSYAISVSVVIEGAGSIEFGSGYERFYILHDSPGIGFAMDDAARELHVEVVLNTEPLSAHCPELAAWAGS